MPTIGNYQTATLQSSGYDRRVRLLNKTGLVLIIAEKESDVISPGFLEGMFDMELPYLPNICANERQMALAILRGDRAAARALADKLVNWE